MPDEDLRCALIPSPVGELLILWGPTGLRQIRFDRCLPPRCRRCDTPAFDAGTQLAAYFSGAQCDFDLPLDLHGTDFQLRVWRELQRIPYGATVTYGELACTLGRPGAARAVGGANHRNPLPIVIPCHRVIGAGSRLTGYAGGLPVKQALLDLERRVLARPVARKSPHTAPVTI